MSILFLSLLTLAGIGVWLACTIRRILRYLLYFQIEEYNTVRFLALLGRNINRIFGPLEIIPIAVLAVASAALSLLLSPTWRVRAFVVLWCVWVAFHLALLWLRKPPATKKTLVLTPRATRLLATAIVLALGLLLAVPWLASGGLSVSQWAARPWFLPVLALWAMLIGRAIGLLLIAANGVMYPVEASFRQYYVQSAQRVFRRHPALKVIAVTGSYGKTSTKEIIAHVLAARYRVLKTPRSFNTLMGICKVIREELTSAHEVFVVEMGTYKKGEIDRLCWLTPPHIGVLTAIGPQHLERFKTVDRVAEAKYELMEHLPAEGVGIFNADDPWCQTLATRPASFRVLRYGLAQPDGPVDVRAAGITITGKGTEFDVSATEQPPVHFSTALLGRHNVSNILAATGVALQCGLTLEEIARAVATLQPVEHRLQRINGQGGVVVIDDAYNSNPAGVRMALDVLAALPGGRKVLVTPGMVELGDREEQEHRQMGILAAHVCDFVILVGAKRTQAIADGLKEKGFPPERILIVPDLAGATRQLQMVVRPGDVVLFENDLPDTYDLDAIYF